jgi:phosphotransferase system enzyme I (PtsI)
MAGDPLAAPLLLGLGLDEWSMDPSSVANVKETVSRLDSRVCAELANRLLLQDTADTVRKELKTAAIQCLSSQSDSKNS